MTLPASDTPHVEGKWCADLHCSKCYGADTWQQSYINELHRSLSAAVAERDKAKLALHWKEHELSGIEADLTAAGYAPQTLRHSNPDGSPREDKLTTGAVVMFIIEDLKQRATQAERRAASMEAELRGARAAVMLAIPVLQNAAADSSAMNDGRASSFITDALTACRGIK